MMEHKITTKLSQEFEGMSLAKSIVVKKRKSSLFDTSEAITGTRVRDHGFAVVTHADYPTRARSKSLPMELEKLSKNPTVFVRENIIKIIKGVLEAGLDGKRYVASECSPLTRHLVNSLRDKVAALELPKYKFICTCYITKRLKPPPTMQSGCAWDENSAAINKDGFAEYVYRNNNLIAVGSVYGIYGEKKSGRGKVLKNAKEIIYPPIPE